MGELGVRHQVESAGQLVGVPGGGAGAAEAPVEVEFRGEGLVGGAVGEEDGRVVAQLGLDLVNAVQLGGGTAAVGVDLFAELLAGLLQLVMVVEEFDGLLEADGDEEAYDDGGDVDEEVAPGVDGLMGRVNVDHGFPRRYSAIIPHRKIGARGSRFYDGVEFVVISR